MTAQSWLDRLSPDISATLQRFPVAIALDALATLVLVASINQWLGNDNDFWLRIFLGLATGAALAVAGVFFCESRPDRRLWGLVLTYGAPLLAVMVFQVTDIRWLTPFSLPVPAVLWLSLAAFTRVGTRDERPEIENRFWWLNYQAITTAVVAGLAYLIVVIGFFAIERSLSSLFNLQSGNLLFKFVLPAIGGFFVPLYWLSTLPGLDDYDPAKMQVPDFLRRAAGFVGQFVLVPLLLAYAVILLAYTAQIVLTLHVPGGMIGWMVLGFAVTGAATWLVLHPAFMRERLLVRIFRRWWFWLTLVPLVLYAIAIGIRVEAYGLTSERVALVAGGVWAATLTVLYLLRQGDIRLIPALAGLVVLLLSIGPWNAVNLSLWSQAARLDALLTGGQVTSRDSKPNWTPEESRAATEAMTYLYVNEPSRDSLRSVFATHGVDYGQDGDDPWKILGDLDRGTSPLDFGDYSIAATRSVIDQPVDVSATPVLLGAVAVSNTYAVDFAGLRLQIVKSDFVVTRGGEEVARVALAGWIARQTQDRLVDPTIDFAIDGLAYRYVVDGLSIDVQVDPDGPRQILNSTQGTLFTTDQANPTP